MGISTGIISLDSYIRGPELGDGGHIGNSWTSVDETDQGKHPFLSVYVDLQELQLITEEVEIFKRFLDQHGHERLRQWEEGGDNPEIDAIWETFDEKGETPPKFKFDLDSDFLSLGYYTMRCGETTICAEWPELFYKFKPVTLEKHNLTKLIERLFEINKKYPEWDLKFRRVGGVLDPYEFFDQIRVMLVNEDGPFEISLRQPDKETEEKWWDKYHFYKKALNR